MNDNNKILSNDKWIGSFIGLTIGDQLGSLVEGRARGTFNRVTGMPEGSFWTDDTSQALCIADSLITTKELDLSDQLERFTKWLFEGYLSCKEWGYGCGPTARTAITNFKNIGKVSPVKDQSTNGALMRLAPVPLFYSKDIKQAIIMSGESSRSTHDNTTCIDACRLYGSMIVKAVQGGDKNYILNYDPELWNDIPLEESIYNVAQGSFKEKNPPEIKGTLNITESIEAALWAFDRSSSFAEGALMAVNLGDDADTTAAIFGQLAGAFYGYKSIPNDWKLNLLERGLIEYIANKLYVISN
tara:strand:- start:471 stop:1370 length:900 start_codon:yes stop_codon:yes gene_type:complete